MSLIAKQTKSNASDPENGPLSYSVDWDDVLTGVSLASLASSNSFTQSATFSHSYSSAGTYTVNFQVKDNASQVVRTSATVRVGNTTQPVVVADVTPSSGPAGTTVSIHGTGFGVTNSITFNGVKTTGRPSRAYIQLGFVVPTGTAPGTYPITVMNEQSGQTSNAVNFTVTSPASTSVTLNPAHDYYFHVKNGTATLGDLSAGGFLISASIGGRTDQVFFMANNPPLEFDSAASTYYRYTSHWFRVGSADVLPESTPTSPYFIIRKTSTGSTSTLSIPSNIFYDGVTDINGRPRPWPLPTSSVFTNQYLESESGAVISPLSVGTNTNASGGSFVSSNTANSGSVSFTLTLPAGTYYLWGRTLSPSADNDSFIVSVDSGIGGIWDTAEQQWSPNWQWTRVTDRSDNGGLPILHNATGHAFTVSSGSHTFTFKVRDLNTKLDRIFITADAAIVPTSNVAVSVASMSMANALEALSQILEQMKVSLASL